MSKYQITLTPVDKFFFGGDMTFQVGNNEKDDFNTQFMSYIIKSSMFPQQTSLLGMLRFLILRNGGNEVFANGHIVNKDNSNKLIGEHSFSVNHDHHENEFGVIKGISHVKVRRTKGNVTTDLEFAPLFKELAFDDNSIGTYNLKDFCIPNISKKEYDAKEGLKLELTDGENRYGLKAVFKEDRRIGNNRNIKTGHIDEGALFKQVSYRFNTEEANYCFVFEAEVDDSMALEDYDRQIISVGADNSQFVLGITKDIKTNNIQPLHNAIYLLSPTFLTREEARKATFAVTKLMPFRFLTEREGNKEDDNRSYHILNSKLRRSDRFELYAPGSVFYFRDEAQKQTFINIIENKREFRQIGYNEYK